MNSNNDPCKAVRDVLAELYAEWEDAEKVYHYDPEMSGYYDLLMRQIEDANLALRDCEKYETRYLAPPDPDVLI